MNKYLHYFGPVLVSSLIGFALGYGYQYRRVEELTKKYNELNSKPNKLDPNIDSFNDMMSIEN